MDIKLDDNIIDVKIGTHNFKVDINSYEAVECLTKFKEEYNFISQASLEMLESCKKVIDTVLGKGTHDKLFGDKKTMKSYLLVHELANIYLDNFMKEERLKSEKESKQVTEIIEKLGNFTKTMQYADDKYGMKKHVSRNTSKRHNDRRN